MAFLHAFRDAVLPHLVSLAAGFSGIIMFFSLGRLFSQVRRLQRIHAEQQEHFEAEGRRRLLVLVGSQKGTGLYFARKLAARAKVAGFQPEVVEMKDYEVENLSKEHHVVIIISTYTDASPPESARWFCKWLSESAADFRVGLGVFKDMRYAVFGCGNQLYGHNFNAVAKAVDQNLQELGSHRVLPTGLGNEDSNDMEAQFDSWSLKLVPQLQGATNGLSVVPRSPVPPYDEDDEDPPEPSDSLADIEDLGAGLAQVASKEKNPKEMLTPMLRTSLTKQGYKLIGSHSGVKMCRWTKSMLRGRGGCYKHSFYGIASHRCMEATPSLACANKCVFCWRHHSNPVGKEWKWMMDAPDYIVQQAVDSHVKMVKEFSGVPGVKPARLSEGYKPQHCALSLVGEPIMYPKINDLIDELHQREMSTFLVTNAQFPDAIRQLHPVTQLYVSVDAATKESLKAVDRPLFSDFWERFQECLSLLKDCRQRTVYRLTLVSGWNMSEVDAYAQLLDLGQPDFIEIKGVTYCGSSDASSLTMKNVPYHHEVCAFGEAICAARGGEYELACEHAHSCCILLARVDRFKKDGQWHTWIDYSRFRDLVSSRKPFTSADYTAVTPDWAVYGAEEAGFDPDEERVKKARNHTAKSEAST